MTSNEFQGFAKSDRSASPRSGNNGEKATSPKQGVVGKKMFDFGKNANSKNVRRPTNQQDAPVQKVPKVDIDLRDNSIVNVMSGDPFKKSHEARTRMRQEHSNSVQRNFLSHQSTDKKVL